MFNSIVIWRVGGRGVDSTTQFISPFFLIYRKPRIYLFWNFLDGNVFFNNFSRVLVIPKIKIHISNTAQNRKFSTRDFFSKCDQIRSFLRIWSHLLKKSLMEDFNFCAVQNFFLKNSREIYRVVKSTSLLGYLIPKEPGNNRVKLFILICSNLLGSSKIECTLAKADYENGCCARAKRIQYLDIRTTIVEEIYEANSRFRVK